MKLHSLMFLALLAAFSADVSAASRPSGHVVAVAAERVDIALKREAEPQVGAVFEVRRVVQGPPKSTMTGTSKRVGRIRVVAGSEPGHAHTVLIDGTARRGDKVRQLKSADR